MIDRRSKKNIWKFIFTEKRSFILLVSLIPLFVYINRFLIPDYSFDTLFYHLFNGVRGAHNYLWPFSPSEFYPIGFGTIAPIYDVLLYVSRLLLGYRLGTVLDLIAYIGIVWVTYELIVRLVNFKIKIAGTLKLIFFLNSVIVTELLFQLATQYVDVINAFFILLSIYTLIVFIDTHKIVYLWLASIILSMAFLGKATNAIYVIPFYVVAVIDILLEKHRSWKLKIGILTLVCIIISVPTLIYWYYNFDLSGNPLFPAYNNIFHSLYSAPISFSAKQGGAGGQTLLQIIFWPVASFWHTAGLAEPHTIFNDWKLGIYWLISMVLFIPVLWKKLTKTEQYLIIFFFLSTELWSFLFGIMRYAADDIIIGGVVLLIFFIRISILLGIKAYFLAIPLVLLMIIDNYRIVNFNLKYDMSWRPNLIHNTSLYLSQRNNLFNNYLSYPTSVSNEINNSQILLDCVHQSAGLIALSGYSSKPVLGIANEAPTEAITGQIKYREMAARKILNIYHQNVLTFTTFAITTGLDVEYKSCLQDLSSMGATVDKIVPLNSFLGYSGEKPVVIIGKINLTSYINSSALVQP